MQAVRTKPSTYSLPKCLPLMQFKEHRIKCSLQSFHLIIARFLTISGRLNNALYLVCPTKHIQCSSEKYKSLVEPYCRIASGVRALVGSCWSNDAFIDPSHALDCLRGADFHFILELYRHKYLRKHVHLNIFSNHVTALL